jgi:hypothetical protein
MWKRIWYAVEWQGPTAFFAFCGLALALHREGYTLFPVVFALIGFGLVWLAAVNTYHKQSVALMDKYDERFAKMTDERKGAANFLLKRPSQDPNGPTGEEDLEDVLDFFEAPLATKLNDGAIGAEQVHDFFYHWIRMYFQASKGYIDDYRAEPGQKEAYKKLSDLYALTSEIELQGMREDAEPNQTITVKDLILNQTQLTEYLESEARLR